MDGGGEFVREAEIEADIMEAVSDINSLAGVSGRIPARTPGAAKIGVDGTSVFGVETTLRVFGAERARGDATEAGVGVGRAGKAESRSVADLSVADGASRFLI